jgi:hypothetical protein
VVQLHGSRYQSDSHKLLVTTLWCSFMVHGTKVTPTNFLLPLCGAASWFTVPKLFPQTSCYHSVVQLHGSRYQSDSHKLLVTTLWCSCMVHGTKVTPSPSLMWEYYFTARAGPGLRIFFLPPPGLHNSSPSSSLRNVFVPFNLADTSEV